MQKKALQEEAKRADETEGRFVQTDLADHLRQICSTRLIERAIAIDKPGTERFDDCFSYAPDPSNPNLVIRSFYVVDFPSIFSADSHARRIAQEAFARSEHINIVNFWPVEMKSVIAVGKTFPVVAFRLKYNPKTAETHGFEIEEAAIKLEKAITTDDLDRLFEKRNARFLEAITKDPDVKKLFPRVGSQRFGVSYVSTLTQAINSRILHWTAEKGVPLIYTHFDKVTGQKNFSTEARVGSRIVATTPFRDFPAFMNLCNIKACMKELPAEYDLARLTDAAKVRNFVEGRKAEASDQLNKKYPICEPMEELAFMINLIDQQKTEIAIGKLEENPRIGQVILHGDVDLICRDLWQNITIHTARMPFKQHTVLAQIVIKKDEQMLRSSVYEYTTKSDKEAEIWAVKDFLKEYIGDRQFTNPKWLENRDVFEVKKEALASLRGGAAPVGRY